MNSKNIFFFKKKIQKIKKIITSQREAALDLADSLSRLLDHFFWLCFSFFPYIFLLLFISNMSNKNNV